MSKFVNNIYKYVEKCYNLISRGSDNMKKYNILLSLNKNKRKLSELVLNSKLSSKKVLSLSRKIDELQNSLEQI